MKVSDLIAGRISDITIVPSNGEKFGKPPRVEAEVELMRDTSSDQLQMRWTDQIVPVAGRKSKDRRLLEDIFDSGGRHFSWVLSSNAGGEQSSITVKNHLFLNQASLPESFRIGVDEKIYDAFQNGFLEDRIPDSAKLDRIRDLFLIPETEGRKVRLQVLPATADSSIDARSFAVMGRRARAIVKLDKDDTWFVDRIHKLNRMQDHLLNSVTLVEADIDFVDSTQAGKFISENHHLLATLENAGDSWVKLWDQYNTREKDQAEKLAIEAGWYSYTAREHTHDGWEFTLDPNHSTLDLIDNIPKSAQLECASKVPESIRKQAPRSNSSHIIHTRKAPHFIGEYIEYDPIKRSIVLSPPDTSNLLPPPSGYLFLSMVGTTVRHQRRVDALSDIRESKSPMKQLQFILEDLPFRAIRQAFKVRKLRSGILDSVFKGKPTDRQARAIHKALQTPDIALIQGPPGTGKTRVIAAIVHHLLHEAENREFIEGNILVCSEQHDAVSNVANVSSVYGIPAPIIGGKGSNEYHGISAQIEGWRRAKIQEIDDKLYDLPSAEIEMVRKRLQKLIASFVRTPPTKQELAALLEEVIELAQDYAPYPLVNQLQQLKNRYSPTDDNSAPMEPEIELCLKAMRSIRTTKEAYADDGSHNFLIAKRRLEQLGYLDQEMQNRFKTLLAKLPPPVPSPPFFKLLEEFKESMIDKLQEQTISQAIPGLGSDIHIALVDVSNAIKVKSKGVLGGPSGVLQEYRDDLENDPFGVQETLRNYAFVLASTAQQSRSRRMMEAKFATIRDGYEFDTVIIDEAARANPLDLLIPMSLAKRRIILVGDHKQLPHIVDPIIEHEVLQSLETANDPKYALHVSLFEKLFHRLKDTEADDGIIRTVTLDTQFRMHPEIGEFVSRHFYKQEKLSSGLPADLFNHGISQYEDRCIKWIDVPFSKGKEKPGKSKSRQVEAKILAEALMEICVNHPELSIGVITFYRAQVREIMKALSKTDTPLTEKSGDQYKIREPFKFIESEGTSFGERLRVGTVDAFQGMEFDVVFLSVVRSNTIHLTEEKRTWTRKYGFIAVENRLCVAMSRAKKLLLTVGDREMFSGSLAAEAIPSLSELSQEY